MSSILRDGKRAILPAWNATHHALRKLVTIGHALADRSFGHCDVCGRSSLFLFRREIIPRRLEEIWGLASRTAEAFARKESCHCVWCGANLRARRIAQALLEINPAGPSNRRSDSIAAWVRRPEVQRLRIAEINGIGGLHERLQALPGLAYSEYEPEGKTGTLVQGVRNESLTDLTYPDASFDLVLTSETLEHVPSLDAALREIKRVLVPGGWHVFTIPWLPTVPATFARASVATDGTIEHELPLIHHPGGDLGYPVFTEFGLDLPMILETAGFDTTVKFGPVTDDDVAQVFVCRKRL